jgi:hypothetical protein
LFVSALVEHQPFGRRDRRLADRRDEQTAGVNWFM